MLLDISKVDRQQAGAQKWRAASGIGTLNWVPRFGKTYGSIMFIINPHLGVNTTNNVIIVVPSEIILKHWEDNLKSYAETVDRIVIYTASYLSANPLLIFDCTLLVVDEPQKFLTPERKTFIDGTRIKHRFRLGLTGTYPYEVPWMTELYPIVDIVTEPEAVENKWIAPFIEYNILLEFPAADKTRYEKFSKPITETLLMFKDKINLFTREEGKLIFPDEFSLIQACHTGFSTIDLKGQTVWITYDRLCNSLAYMLGWHIGLDVTIPVNEKLHNEWSPMAIHNRAKIFMEYILKRNTLMIENPVKLHTIGEIIANNLVTTICFNESTAFADSVADYINARFNGAYRAAVYHSKMDSRTMIDPNTGDTFKYTTGDRKGLPKLMGKDAIKKIVLDGIRVGFYQCISTAKALDEGVDLPSIEQVICSAGTTNPITYQQRSARGKTIDIYNPNKVTKIFNLVFDDFINNEGETVKSRDKTKLIMRQKQTGASVRWVKSVNEINFSTFD